MRGIVEAHGGRVWAEAAEAGGACLCFTLPVAAAATQPRALNLPAHPPALR